MQRFYSLDVVKVLAAFLVICIHLPFPGLFGEYLVPITKIAVPYFFIVSGFFIWDKEVKVLKYKIISNIKKIFGILIASNVLYFFWKVFMVSLSSTKLSNYLSTIFNREVAINFLFFNESPFSDHLWYLSAYLYVLIIYYFLVHFEKVKYIYSLVPILLIGSFALGGNILLMRNFIFIGIPYFFIGNLIRIKFENDQLNFKSGYAFVGIVLSYILSLFEQRFYQAQGLMNNREHYIGTTFFVSLIFLLLVMKPSFMEKSGFDKIADYTLYIYIFHPIIITIYREVISFLPKELSNGIELVGPFFIFFLSLLSSIVWVFIKSSFKARRN